MYKLWVMAYKGIFLWDDKYTIFGACCVLLLLELSPLLHFTQTDKIFQMWCQVLNINVIQGLRRPRSEQTCINLCFEKQLIWNLMDWKVHLLKSISFAYTELKSCKQKNKKTMCKLKAEAKVTFYPK